MTEALGARGFLHMGIMKPLGYIAKPFQRGFEGALDTAGIYLKESLMHLVKDDVTNAQVDAFVNKFRGLMATRTLGLGHFQQQLEPAVSLAPQYTRAIVSILTDLARGNIRGKLARESLAKGTTAVIAASVAVSLSLGENFDKMLEHFDPNSPKFLTWLIAGQYVGPGSKVRTIIKLLADSAKNPDDLLSLSMRNPGLRFLRGMSSPTVSTGIDILTGKNYMGDPTRENMLQLTKTVVAENMVPLWIQSLALEGGNVQQRLLGAAEQFGGLRQYPITPKGLPQYMEDYFNAHPTSDVNLDNLIQGYKKDRDLFAEYDKLTGKARQLYREEHPQIEAMLYFWGKINSLSDKAKPYLNQIKMHYDVGDDMVESREKAWEDTTKGGLTGTRKKTQEEIFLDFVDILPMFAAEYVWQNRGRYENKVDANLMKLIDEMNMADNQLVEQYYSATADMKASDKEKYRARFPEIDVALNMRGRASVFQSQAALKLFKSRLRELGLPDDIAEKKVDTTGKQSVNKPISVGGGLLQRANP